MSPSSTAGPRRFGGPLPRAVAPLRRLGLGVASILAASWAEPVRAVPADLLPLGPGRTVVTCGSTVGEAGYVLAVVDTSCPVDRALSGEWPRARHVSLPADHGESGAPAHDWRKRNFDGNELFGLALDDAPAPNVYVASTSAYGRQGDSPTIDFLRASGDVFRVDGVTGEIERLIELPNSALDPARPDATAPGLGNLAHDPRNDQLLVTNMEDGTIALVDVEPSPTPLGTYDPWASDDGTPGFAPRVVADAAGRLRPNRIWGIGVFEGRAYFGTWSSDARDVAPSSRLDNAVYSVEIAGRGALVGPPRLEVQVPPGANGISDPISDIAFTARDGGRMLVAERAMEGEKTQATHDSRVLEWQRVGGEWLPSSGAPWNRTWTVGIPAETNAGGGIDYYEPACAGNAGCPNEDARIVMSAEPVVNNHDPFGEGPFDVYGLLISSIDGDRTETSWWYDVDDDPTGSEDKGLVGDVEMFDRCAADAAAPVVEGCATEPVLLECGQDPPGRDVHDDCDEAPTLVLETPGSPPRGCDLEWVRSWRSEDCSGNVGRCDETFRVVDTLPPVVTPSDDTVACVWPPNHWFVCFSRTDLAPVVEDACDDAPTWRFAGCVSDQCDEAPCDAHPGENGDGAFEEDCVASDDWICVRAERAGTDPHGRTYGIAVVASDACGNESEPVVVGTVHVPHDQSPRRADCVRTTRVGCRVPAMPSELDSDPCRAAERPGRAPRRGAALGGRPRAARPDRVGLR